MGIVTRENVVFASLDGRELRMNLAWLEEPPVSPRPAVVWIHGGGWCGGDHLAGEHLPLAERGYFGANIEYRLSQEAIFPAQIHDCKAALRYLRGHAEEYHLDPDRIGVWGASAGGHLSALLGTSAGVAELEGDLGHPEQSSAVQAVVNYCGPSDLTQMLAGQPELEMLTEIMDQFLGGPLAERLELARLGSPLTHAGPTSAPFLTVHGERDEIVPFGQAALLHEALRQAGVESTLVPVAKGGHDLQGEPAPERISQLSIQFFDRHLRR